MDINYEYYKIFYYAAKYRSFTRAAEALYCSEGFRTVGERRGFYHGTDAVLADLEI